MKINFNFQFIFTQHVHVKRKQLAALRLENIDIRICGAKSSSIKPAKLLKPREYS